MFKLFRKGKKMGCCDECDCTCKCYRLGREDERKARASGSTVHDWIKPDPKFKAGYRATDQCCGPGSIASVDRTGDKPIYWFVPDKTPGQPFPVTGKYLTPIPDPLPTVTRKFIGGPLDGEAREVMGTDGSFVYEHGIVGFNLYEGTPIKARPHTYKLGTVNGEPCMIYERPK